MKFITPIFCLFVNYLVAQEFSPPNILLINVDDLGWRDVGFMGSKYYETPHLDSLSSQGSFHQRLCSSSKLRTK